MPDESSKDIREIAVNDATIGQAIEQAFGRRSSGTVRPASRSWSGRREVVHRDAGEVLAELDAKGSSAG